MRKYVISSALLIASIFGTVSVNTQQAQAQHSSTRNRRVCAVTNPIDTALNVREQPNGRVINRLKNDRRVYIDTTANHRNIQWAKVSGYYRGKYRTWGWVLREFISCYGGSSGNNIGNNSTIYSNSQFPSGKFRNSKWEITLWKRNGRIYYQGRSRTTPASLYLENGSTSGTSRRKIYTWKNGTYSYQVIWRPNDPNYIRLRVFTPRREISNQILSRS